MTRISIFILLFSLQICYSQNECYSVDFENKSIDLSISLFVEIQGKNNQLNELLASHFCKCNSELASFDSLLHAIDNSFPNKKLKFIPSLDLGTNPVAEGAGIGSVIINMNFLRQLPDPILKPSISKQKIMRDTLNNIYRKENVPGWAGTICSFLAHELVELRNNIEDDSINRSLHHCQLGNQAEDLIILETFGNKRTRGWECVSNHLGHKDIIIEIINKGYIIYHARFHQNYFEDGELISSDDPLEISYIEYLNQQDYTSRKYNLENCECQN